MRDCLLSVAICTFNRAAFLDDALQSFSATHKPPGICFELLIIDNNSGDSTPAIVNHCVARSSFPVRHLLEAKQGLSLARNRAVKEAAGQWIWFVDDDVFFSPGWLEAVLEGIRFFPEASVLGGLIRLAFEPEKPHWLPSAALPYYGMTFFGDELRWLKPTEYPRGANMAFRKTVFDEVGLFREDLGRVGDSLLSSEETDIVIKLRERGHKIGYVPAAAVQHRIPPDRATMSWLRRRAYWGGISQVLTVEDGAGSSRLALFREAARTIRNVARAALTNGVGLGNQIEYAWRLGKARQYLAEVARSKGPRVLRSGFGGCL